jgi:dTDP-glucose 4,6-dehydratase
MSVFVVTGGRGFIGSHFVEEALEQGHTICDIDKMTYAAHANLPWDNHPNYSLTKSDILDIDHIPVCDALVHFAAESHVDNSINAPMLFEASNCKATVHLLELLRGKIYSRPLFVHISTDEVYGDVRGLNSIETDILNPSNPYSASKAAAEMFVYAYQRTYGIDYVITRSSNNYGQRQYPEKLIPSCVRALQTGQQIELHGDGSYIRDWIYVKDNVCGIFTAMSSGRKNEIFNVGAQNHMTNIEVARTIMSWMGYSDFEKHVKFVDNRSGQDERYAMDSSKLMAMGWEPKHITELYNFLQ